jgi:putative ABC transport system permease protein
MRFSNIADLYRVRVQARLVLVQELFAMLGIAVGVALLFASQIATTSLNESVSQLTTELVGRMQFQLDARSAEGFDQRLLGEVQHLPGVRSALPVIERPANLIGPKGQQAVDLIGTEPRFARRGSPLLGHFSYGQLESQRVLALPSQVAQTIGAGALTVITAQVGASSVHALVGIELSAASIGTLAHSPVAVAPLSYAQTLTRMGGRLNRIFVQADAGREREVHTGLVRLAAGTQNVEPADFDATLFRVAAAPVNQNLSLFSAISAMVGFMFAINAMLLTLHLRQGLVRELRANGATRVDAIKALLFDALVLGVLASLPGLVLGDLLSISLFDSNPGYLQLAFPIGSQRIVTWQSAAIAAGVGLLAACVGVLTPLREIWSRSSRVPGPPEHQPLGRWTLTALAGGLMCPLSANVV